MILTTANCTWTKVWLCVLVNIENSNQIIEESSKSHFGISMGEMTKEYPKSYRGCGGDTITYQSYKPVGGKTGNLASIFVLLEK